MQKWLNARSAKLLTDINNTQHTDTSDEDKIQLIMSAMRESSVEMFHRAAENSRKDIDKINSIAKQESIREAEIKTASKETKEVKPLENAKPAPKVKLTSTVIRR